MFNHALEKRAEISIAESMAGFQKMQSIKESTELFSLFYPTWNLRWTMAVYYKYKVCSSLVCN